MCTPSAGSSSSLLAFQRTHGRPHSRHSPRLAGARRANLGSVVDGLDGADVLLGFGGCRRECVGIGDGPAMWLTTRSNIKIQFGAGAGLLWGRVLLSASGACHLVVVSLGMCMPWVCPPLAF